MAEEVWRISKEESKEKIERDETFFWLTRPEGGFMAHEHGEHEHQERRRHKYRRPGRGYLIGYEELLVKPERITKEELVKLIEEGKNPLILDVRNDRDYEESDIKIKGSVRVPPSHVHDIIEFLPRDRLIVTY